MRRPLRVLRQTESALRVAKALKHAGCDSGWSTCRSTSRNRETREQQEKGPDHPGARVAVKRQEQLGVSSQGAKDLPQGLAEGEFASSDRTRRWTCLLRVTAQAREEEHKTPQQQAPPDMQTGQSIRACLRREVPADHEAHSQPQRRQLRRVAKTKLRRECTPEAEAGKATPRSHPCSD